MSAKEKVLAKYPDADVIHRKMLGVTLYAIRIYKLSSYAAGFGYTASKAWVNAAKRIEAGAEPERYD